MTDEPRYWVDGNIPYRITFESSPAEYVGLVDEEAGGIVAYGAYANITNLCNALNSLSEEGEL